MATEWKKVKLGEICSKIGSGATPSGGSRVYIENGISFIRSQNVYNLNFDYEGLTHITDEAAKKLNGVTIEKDDVLLNITGDSVARTCIVPKNVLPARVNQHVSIIRPKEKTILPKFLNYYLASPYMQSVMLGLAVGKGASRNAITKTMIENFEVPYPPLETQKRIAGILSAYDDLIENNRKQIKLLEEASQNLYKEWFVKLNFPGHENTKIVDGVPEGWKKVRAEDYFEVTIGKTPPRNESKWFSKGSIGKKWISIADMGNSGVFIFQTSENLTNEAIESKNVKIIPENTVLLSFKLTVGRVSITTEEMTTNEAIAHFVTDNKFIREYIYLYLKNFHYDSLGSTSAISTAINSKIVKSMPIIIPPESLLENFSKLAARYFDKIKSLQNQIQLLQSARDKLLPKLMNGELI